MPGTATQIDSSSPFDTDDGGVAAPLSREFFRAIDQWYDTLVGGLVRDESRRSTDQPAHAVRTVALYLLFLAIGEQRGCLPGGTLSNLSRGPHTRRRMLQSVAPFSATPATALSRIRDASIQRVVATLLEPGRPHWLTTPSSEMLGAAYEHLLARGIRRTSCGGGPRDKGGVRKTGGRYYTPAAVVDDMVADTVDPLLENATVSVASNKRILDPACGGGVFLIRTFRRLLDWHGRQYESDGADQHAQAPRPRLRHARRQRRKLTLSDRLRILGNGLFGVDIDPQAVEITRLSLMIELLAGLADTPQQSLSNAHGRACRDTLSNNFKSGNALVGRHPPDAEETLPPAAHQQPGLKPFDWQTEFPTVFDRDNPGFDIVLGNPPYVDSEEMTSRWKALREYCTVHYRTARGNWDLFCVFVERALDASRDGGRVCLLVPNKLASADYAASVRELLGKDNRLLSIRDYSQVPLFDASVYPMVFLAAREKPRPAQDTIRGEWVTSDGPGQQKIRRNVQPYDRYFEHPRAPWSILADRGQAQVLERMRQFPSLAAHAQVLGAATVAEAYAIQPLISEAVEGQAPCCRKGVSEPESVVAASARTRISPESDRTLASAATVLQPLRVVNSGTVDRYRDLWGQKRMRYLGDTYLRPVIRPAELSGLPEKRRQQAATPKIIVAGMTRRLECTWDPRGQVLAGKSTSIILCRWDLRYLLALLNSSLISFYYRTVFAGNRLQGGYLRVGPPQLKSIPVVVPTQREAGGQDRKAELVALVDEMLGCHRRFARAGLEEERQRLIEQVIVVDHQIDELVCDLYGLTQCERRTVEDQEK